MHAVMELWQQQLHPSAAARIQEIYNAHIQRTMHAMGRVYTLHQVRLTSTSQLYNLWPYAA